MPLLYNIVMSLQKKTVKIFAYVVGSLVLTWVTWNEEFYDGIRFRYWDMSATLNKWPSCFEKWGLETFSSRLGDDSNLGVCLHFNYGIFTMPLYRIMASISQDESFWTIFLFGIFIILMLSISKNNWRIHAVSLIVLISPPAVLLFESGNPDLLNLIFSLGAGIALQKRLPMLFYFCVAFITLHKFYGIVIWLTLLAGRLTSKLREIIVGGLVIVLTIFILGFQYFSLGIYPFIDAASNHFGITIWDNYLRKAGFSVNQGLIQFLGIATLVVFVTLFLKTKPSQFYEAGPLRVSTSSALVTYLVFIFAYISTSNVDYRLTFLGVAIALDSEHYISRGGLSRFFGCLAIVSLYLSYPMGYRELLPGIPLQAIGDIILHVVVFYCCVRAWALLRRLRMDLAGNQLRI